ncbi:hypothetical protein GCM10022240_01020 [Microbacterium kribbense]|uniref:HTH merR-type domain-containing protein n=1 Tax=Microbacterium kribbense TaxID=433645 RepID=A0ABP7G1L6_9MICO
MDWSIHELATFAGTTSRTLRHYDAIGLLAPTRTTTSGYRHYDRHALIRLQRILLLRELGLALPQIAEVLDRTTDEVDALTTHLALLRQEQERLARQIAAVAGTIAALNGEEQLMAEQMFDGFDHTVYREEVETRWGRDAYARSDAWWRGMDADARAQWQRRSAECRLDGCRRPRRRRRQRRGAGTRAAACAVAGRHSGHAGRRARWRHSRVRHRAG